MGAGAAVISCVDSQVGAGIFLDFILFYFSFISNLFVLYLEIFCILSLPWKFINLFVTANIKKDHNGLNKRRRDGAIAGGVIGGVIVSLIPHFLLPSLPLLSFSPWGYYL